MKLHAHAMIYSRVLIEGLLLKMKEGVIALHADTTIALVNRAALNLLGIEQIEEVAGKPIDMICANWKENRQVTEGLWDEFENVKIPFLCPDGRIFLGLCSSHTGVDPETGERLTIILIHSSETESSEQKLADCTQQIMKLSKEIDQFAYIVSHDLKAPLRAISNLSLWLHDDLQDSLSDDNKKNLNLLRGRVQRLESLVNGILEYSKLGKEQPSESIDVYLLVQEVVDSLAPPLEIAVEVSANLPVIEGPRTKLIQVFSNLISNAIKFNDKPDGIIKVYSRDNKAVFEFIVEDNGPGIPKEFFEKVFMLFQTLQSKDTFESTGIGLTIVKRIVEERGGKIWIESEMEKGTRFIFSWPKSGNNNSISKIIL
jgi:signal transduction histidine kinase